MTYLLRNKTIIFSKEKYSILKCGNCGHSQLFTGFKNYQCKNCELALITMLEDSINVYKL